MAQELLKDVVYRRIREMIILGALPMGSKLSEGALALKLNATKAPIRDALKRLQSEGLVQIKPKSGTFVFHTNAEELHKLLEFRFFIEVEGLKLAWEHHPKTLIQELSLIIDKMELCLMTGGLLEYLQLDNTFHQKPISLCENNYFMESYDLISSRMATVRNHLSRNEDHLKRSLEQHKSIVEALQKKDIERAQEQLRSHILPQHGAYWKVSNLA